MERVMGLEPTISAWKANVLPLHYTRIMGRRLGKRGSSSPQASYRSLPQEPISLGNGAPFSRIESRSRLTPPPSRSETKKPAAKIATLLRFFNAASIPA